jgi:cobalt-zinc-cadmium resistance protein CzcA
MVQYIVRRLGERVSEPHERSVDDTIRRAAIEMQRPVFFSMVIIIAAYLPLLTLERVERGRHDWKSCSGKSAHHDC